MLQLKLNLLLKITFVMSYCFCLVITDKELLQCYNCDSSNGENCLSNTGNVTAKECEKCFTEIDGDGKVSRGCFSVNATKICGDDEKCRLCTTDKCNNNKICKSCTSNDKDPGCAQTGAHEPRYNSVCSRSNNLCVTKLNNRTEVVRSCGSSETCRNFGDDKCVACSESGCNVDIFPKNRTLCFQCSGEECAKELDMNNESDKTKLLPCRLYDSNEKCYISGKNETYVERGCSSDIEDITKCENCSYCTDTSCNNRSYKRYQKLECLQCNDCSGEQKSEDAKTCVNQLLYYQEDACFIALLANNTVQRGCLHDRTDAEGAIIECVEPDCEKCTDRNGCNSRAWVGRDTDGNNNGTTLTDVTCIRCRSDLEPKCVAEAQKLAGEKCMSEASKETKEDCYTGIWNGVTIRDCMTNANDRQKVACLNRNNCVTCSGKNCNNAKASAISTFANRNIISVLALCFALPFFTHMMS